MNETDGRLNGHRIGLVGKGGSGKSTLTVLLARALRGQDYEVCVVDADSTNIGLAGALGLEQAPESLVDYFGGMVFAGGQISCPVDDPTPLAGAEIELGELPRQYAGRTREGIWFLRAGKMGRRGPGAGCDGPMAKISRDLRIQVQGEECVTLIDFKAGFEDSARGVIVGLDWVVVVVDPNRAAVEMALDMTHLVEQIQQGEEPATAHLDDPDLVEATQDLYRKARIREALVVLNRIGPESLAYLEDLLAERGLAPVAAIAFDPSVALSWMTGERLGARQSMLDIEMLVSELERRAASQDSAEPGLPTSSSVRSPRRNAHSAA